MPVTSVVVVEDDPDIGLLVRTRLETEGFRVKLVTENFHECFDSNFWEGWDGAVIDLMLPGETTGVDILRHLRDTHSGILRIGFSAITENVKDDDLGHLADVWVQKPDTDGVLRALALAR